MQAYMEEAALKETFGERDKFAKMCGIVIDTAADGTASGHVDLAAHHLNAAGSAQGGILFTLADTVAAAAANSRGPMAVTVQTNCQYVRGVGHGRLTAKAHEVAPSKKLPSYTVEITDDAGRVIFISTAIFYVKENPLPQDKKQETT